MLMTDAFLFLVAAFLLLYPRDRPTATLAEPSAPA
jgi:hypothetical protein